MCFQISDCNLLSCIIRNMYQILVLNMKSLKTKNMIIQIMQNTCTICCGVTIAEYLKNRVLYIDLILQEEKA